MTAVVSWLLALSTLSGTPPPTLDRASWGRVEPASEQALLRLDDCASRSTPTAAEKNTAEQHADGSFRCEGHHLALPAGVYRVRLIRPGQRDVTASVTVVAARTVVVDAEPAPAHDDTFARSWAVTGVAVGTALILTAILVVSLDGDESAEMRLALPLAIGLGSGLLVGSAHAVRHLDASADAPYPGTFSVR